MIWSEGSHRDCIGITGVNFSAVESVIMLHSLENKLKIKALFNPKR